MPYKRVGKRVYVKKDGGWRLLKEHKDVAQAKNHITALRINVRHR